MRAEHDDLFSSEEQRLAAEIERHNRLYWEVGEPEIDDKAYDALLRRLRDINPNHEVLHKIYGPAAAGDGKVRHEKPMLSLDKAYAFSEVLDWAKKYARNDDEMFAVQPKFDGVSAEFADGALSTRGDGYEGENITAKLPLIELETAGYRGPLDRPARGELIIREDDFRERWPAIRKKDGKPYKNSRNAVAGIMGLKDIADMVRQGARLTLVDYDMISYRVSLKELPDAWPEIVENIRSSPYPLDGIVIKLADRDYSESLGTTAHHPRGQIAFKFTGEKKETTLLDVEWSFGKNCLTPVAKLAPVDIGGITIKQASLHNAKNIIDRGIMIGDTVTVERAGDVIPYVIDSKPGAERRPCLIDRCPCCETLLLMDGPELRCPNPECGETLLRRLLAAARNIGVERLGEPNIRKMVQTLGVKTLNDIFDLTIPKILSLEGFQNKSATNLYNEIQAARNAADYQVLAALNVYSVGQTLAKTILENHSLEELRRMTAEELSAIPGVGPERAAALERELREQSAFLDALLARVNMKASQGAAAARGDKPTICFTGKMPEKRDYYERLAESRGYLPADSVTKDLSVLVAAAVSDNSAKLKKARAAGVRIVSLDEWLTEKAPATAEAPDGLLPGF